MNVIYAPNKLDSLEFLATEATALSPQWDSDKSVKSEAPHYRLAIDPETIWFWISLPCVSSSESRTGEYVEGLWEGEVGELFIFESNSSRYQEFNFAADGSWWAMRFLSYRKRDANFAKPNAPELKTNSDRGRTEILAQIQNESVKLNIKPHPLQFNISAILRPQNKPEYFSAVHLTCNAPDFHSAVHFYSNKE